MQGISRTICSGPIIELAGQKFTISPRTLRHYGEIESQILCERGNPFDRIREAKERLADDVDEMKAFVTLAFDEARQNRSVSFGEIEEYLRTSSGFVHGVWLAIRHNDPSLTLDSVGKLVVEQYGSAGREDAEEWKEELLETIAAASGDDELSRLDFWPSLTKQSEGSKLNWMVIYRRLASEPYGMSIDEINNLTLIHVRYLLGNEEEIAGEITTTSAGAIGAIKQRFQEAKAKAIDNLMQGKRWDAI